MKRLALVLFTYSTRALRRRHSTLRFERLLRNTGHASRLVLLLLVIGASLALSSESTQAYSSIRISGSQNVRWDFEDDSRANVANGRILYEIDSLGTTDRGGFTGSVNEFKAIQNSFITWRNLDRSDIDFEFTGTVEDASANGNDDRNQLFWSDDLDPATYAETVTTFNPSTGQILDADMELNDGDFVWDTLGSDGSAGVTIIENIVVHEIGHLLGLDHSLQHNATLFAATARGSTSMISLELDDEAQLNIDYPDSSAPDAHRGSVAGSVTNNASGVFGVVVHLIDIATGEVVINAISERNTGLTVAGNFLIQDVPQGNYWAIAAPLNPNAIGAYYSSSFTNFQTTPYDVAASTASASPVIAVAPDGAVTGIDIEVRDATNSFEPNNRSEDAFAMTMGSSLGARIENNTDSDWYSVDAAAGEEVSVSVYAHRIGSELDPMLIVYESDGTTKLLSGDANDLAEDYFSQEARDLQDDAFGADAPDFDCVATFTADSAGTYYIEVKSQKFDEIGAYALFVTSDQTFTSVDANASTLSASVPAGHAGGSDVTFTVTPLASNFATLSGSRTVELLDLTGGSSTVLDTITSSGPFEFTVSAPVDPATITYGARIDGTQITSTIAFDWAGALDTSMTVFRVVEPSIVAFNEVGDFSDLVLTFHDSDGRLFVDETMDVEMSTSAGDILPIFVVGGPFEADPELRRDADFRSDYRAWALQVRGPETPTTLTLNAYLNGNVVATSQLQVLANAGVDTPDPGTSNPKSSGGGGGCAMSAGESGWPFAWLAALLFFVRARIYRRKSHA